MWCKGVRLQLVNLKKTDQIDHHRAVLSDAERARAGRFLREADAVAYIISHAELRYALAKILNCAPVAIEIETDQHGKPFLPHAKHVYFNLSHAGGYALIAVSQAGAVGVDIEKINPKTDCLAIAKRFFAQEEYLYILSSESQTDAFFRVWTLKEAFVKAVGRGLAYGMDNFSVVSSEKRLMSQVEDYQLQTIDVPHGYVGAVAFKANK